MAIAIEITEQPLAALAEHARIDSAFEVRTVLDVASPAGGFGGLVLTERPVDAPYIRDFDDDRSGAATWADYFDVSRWGLIAAHLDGQRVGGAVIAFDTPGVRMLEGRTDLAVLWDLRVAAEARGQGVGSALFRAVEAWAMARECRWLKIETSTVNVPACRFYARQGCLLGAIHRLAYPEVPEEAMLLWYKQL